MAIYTDANWLDLWKDYTLYGQISAYYGDIRIDRVFLGEEEIYNLVLGDMVP